ncbi:hypothetical protein B0T25DRAFT_181659 [Lasiosphaeria hispida]|uniref:Clr5 domain-containing protein n=1 Tax=Lasiosphaeria hispida TaxID=260671 RepID=A0AAJ0HGM3_9PEZI|nr:hypothetical protein B0T25DRAFT_181659 [Lasiosphaeria hispida]
MPRTKDPREYKFVDTETKHHNAKRITDEEWQRQRETMLDIYINQNKTLDMTIEEMKSVHGFTATRRQYIHILDKWEKRKYNKDKNAGALPSGPSRKQAPRYGLRPSTPEDDISEENFLSSAYTDSPGLQTPTEALWVHRTSFPQAVGSADDPLADGRLHLESWHQAADILFACGDGKSAFRLYMDIPVGPESPSPNLIACARAAQTPEQAKEVRQLLQEKADELCSLETREDEENPSGGVLLLDLLLPCLFSWDEDEDRHGSTQVIETQIKDILCDQPRGMLKPITHRGPKLDVPLYQHLSYAFKLWNDRTGEDLVSIQADELLDQFVAQQRASADEVGCLILCLQWCHEVLVSKPRVPEEIRVPFATRIRSPEAVYQVIFTLWYAWVKCMLPSASTSSPPGSPPYLVSHLFRAWATDAQPQLGISPAELLVSVIHVIMAEAAQATGRFGIAGDVLDAARNAAESLIAESPEYVVRCFLNQVREDGNRRMSPTPGGFPGIGGPAGIFPRFRTFISRVLQVELPNDDVSLFPLSGR